MKKKKAKAVADENISYSCTSEISVSIDKFLTII